MCELSHQLILQQPMMKNCAAESPIDSVTIRDIDLKCVPSNSLTI